MYRLKVTSTEKQFIREWVKEGTVNKVNTIYQNWEAPTDE